MQTLTEKIWKASPPHGLFDETVVQNLFPGFSGPARKALVHRASQKGEILYLKPGLYCLNQDYNPSPPHPFIIAAMLHSPSYVSMESALWFHQMIPEALCQVASVIPERSRVFKTPLGVFSFFRVPCNFLMAGVRAEKFDNNAWAFVAGPLRAIADLVYRNRETTWQKHGMEFLLDSLRMEQADLFNLPLQDYKDIYESFRNKRVKEFLKGLKQEIGK